VRIVLRIRSLVRGRLTPERVPIDWIVDQLAATDAALLASLGEHDRAIFAGRGAALAIGDAVAYLRSEADRVLATQ